MASCQYDIFALSMNSLEVIYWLQFIESYFLLKQKYKISLSIVIRLGVILYNFNSVMPTGSTLDQVTAQCLRKPSNYLTQRWLYHWKGHRKHSSLLDPIILKMNWDKIWKSALSNNQEGKQSKENNKNIITVVTCRNVGITGWNYI